MNQVRPCHITPEKLEFSKVTITNYTKHFRKELNATDCRIQHLRENGVVDTLSIAALTTLLLE